jgi:putative membrane protein
LRTVRTMATAAGVVRVLVYRRSPVLLALLIRWALIAVAFALTAWIVSGMEVTGGFWAYVWIALLFGIVNALLGTILRILTFPLIVLTLGLFALIVNAIVLSVTDAITDNLTIDDFFWTTILAALVLAIVTVVLDVLVALVLGRAAD